MTTGNIMSLKFSTLVLNPKLLENLKTLGFQQMTPVQAEALPAVLSQKDVIVQAKTGSGKTAVFGLHLLENLNTESLDIQCLVLCPTRELADQVATELRKFARAIANVKIITLCGGVPLRKQVNSLEVGAHIVIGTPGRIEDHLKRGTLDLSELNVLVLDEADRMLDMGFEKQVDFITEQISNQPQVLLFSATYPKEIEAIAKKLMSQPVMVKVAGDTATDIKQKFYKVADNEARLEGIQLILHQDQPDSVLVFCNTKSDVKALAKALGELGFYVLALHGEMEQKDRDQTLIRFSNNSTSILVATDIAARGLDINQLDAVINYHVASDVAVYMHRIGRTGRAGFKGIAHSFYADKESYKMTRLEEYLQVKIDNSQLPEKSVLSHKLIKPKMMTLRISGGKKQKLRAGDILGALTAEHGIQGSQVGKISLFEDCAYVAVERKVAQKAMNKLINDKIKGKNVKVWLLKD